MDKCSEVASWSSEPQMHLSTDSESSIFHSPFDTSPHSSFMDTSYSAPESTSSFVHSSDTFSHANSTTGSYDSQQPDLSTRGHIYEASTGNGNSTLSGSMLSSEELRSSSMTSSLTGTDPHSRKASMSSSHEIPLPNSLVESPEFEDPHAVVAATAWPSASASVGQQSSTYGFRYNGTSIAPDACVSTGPSFYTPEHINVNAGPSQAVHPYSYPSAASMDLMTPANLSALPIGSMAGTVAQFQSYPSSGPGGGSSSVGPLNGNSSMTGDQSNASTSTSGKGSSTTNGGSARRAKFRRSRTGCMVCRKRKVKCDQDGQPCKQCRIGKRDCHYEENPPKRKRKGKGENEQARKEKSESSEMQTGSIDLPSNPHLLTDGGVGLSSSSLPPPPPTAGHLPIAIKANDGALLLSADKESDDEARRAREAAEDLKRTAEALFAQHTNFDQVNLDEGNEVAKGEKETARQGDRAEAFSLQYTNDADSAHSLEPWATLSNQTGPMTEDWSNTTPSTGPSSNKTVEGDPLATSYTLLTNAAGTPGSVTLEEKSQMGSPFDKYLGLEDEGGGGENVVEIEASNGGQDHQVPWYGTQSRSESMTYGTLSGLEGAEACLVGPEGS